MSFYLCKRKNDVGGIINVQFDIQLDTQGYVKISIIIQFLIDAGGESEEKGFSDS